MAVWIGKSRSGTVDYQDDNCDVSFELLRGQTSITSDDLVSLEGNLTLTSSEGFLDGIVTAVNAWLATQKPR